jgi:peptidoglycan/LPS O-acetylase OafA/YrhL
VQWLAVAAFVGAHVLLYEGVPHAKLVYAPAVALVIATFLVRRPVWARPLASRMMVYIGKRSYAVYLVQMICLSICISVMKKALPGVAFSVKNEPTGHGAWAASIALLVVGTVASLLVAEALYRTIEGPMIARGRIWTQGITGKRPATPPRLADEQEATAAPGPSVAVAAVASEVP